MFATTLCGAIATSTGTPEVWAPFPLTVILPLFITGSRILAVIPLAILSFVITLPVLAGNTRLRWYSWSAPLIVASFSWLNLFLGSSYSWGYHGVAYTLTCVAANFAFSGALAVLWIKLRRGPSFVLVEVFHAALSLWLATYAFAYLGELP